MDKDARNQNGSQFDVNIQSTHATVELTVVGHLR